MKKRIQKEQQKNKQAIQEMLEKNGEGLLPLLQVLKAGRIVVNELIYSAGQALLESLLQISAEELAGKKQRGKRGEAIYWHGQQGGVVHLQERKIPVIRPRLRRKAGGRGAEVEIPAYREMQTSDVGNHMLASLLRGVSTRKYEEVLPQMADSVGIAKSSVSRNAVRISEKKLREFAERRWDEIPLLVIYMDGVRVGDYQVLVALGVDKKGEKHVLGLREGTTENAEVVKALLADLVERGVSPAQPKLFVIDGGKALRKGIRDVFGAKHPVQRCRLHKERNVMGHLPKEEQQRTRWILQAAWKCEAAKGIAKIQEQADWLEKRYPSAAASLREGLEEMFTVKRLHLSASLCRSLGTTNLIENPNSLMRRRTRNVTHWKDGHMVMRWMATAFMDSEEHYHRIGGYKDLWMLEAALQAFSENAILDKVA
jgi:transposase-like protein